MLTEGIAIDNPFRSTEDRMRWDGTSVIPDEVARQQRLIARADEPFAAASLVRVPVLLMLAGREEAAPSSVGDGAVPLRIRASTSGGSPPRR